MTFKDYIKKTYLEDPELNIDKIIIFIIAVNFISLIVSTLWMIDLIGTTNDLLQKENVINKDNEYRIDIDEIDFNKTYQEYYREKVILVPFRMYVYFVISGFSLLFFVENSFNLLIKYIKYKKHGHSLI